MTNVQNPPVTAVAIDTDSEAIADRRVRRRLLFLMAPVATAMFALFNGIQQVILPGHVEEIDPVNKIGNLGLIMSICAVTSVFGLLAGGAVSDRTVGRWGRRTPSLVVSALAAAILTIVLGATSTLTALIWTMAALWFVVNYYQGALTAILPDRIPAEHRGVASSMIALGVPIGVIVGVNVGAQLDRPLALAILGLLLVLMTAAMVFLAPEPPAYAPVERPDAPKTPLLVRFLGFFESFRSFDFTIAMIARLLMFFSIFSVTAYTYYILQDYVGTKNLPSGDIKFSVSLMITIQMLACLASTAVSGWLVDRWGTPKLFVGISSIGIAIAFAIPMFSPSWPAMLAMQTGVGFFFGAYMAIDLALMSLVLPDPENEGRDMALLSAAAGLPQMLTPMFAAAMIAHVGYYALFGAGALSALAAGVLIFLIRSVR